MNNFIVYVINLDRSTSRLRSITTSLHNIGLNPERITAIDGSLATAEQLAMLDEEKYRLKHGKTSLPGELGCYLSHLNAINKFLSSENDFAVILEDDASIEKDFSPVIRSLISHSQCWDMVKISGVHSGTPLKILSLHENYYLSIMLTKCTGSSAYLINRKAAAAYSKNILPMSLPYDHEFDKGWKYNIKVRGVTPFAIKHDDSNTSTILPVNNKSKRKLSFSRRIPTHIYRIINEIRRVYYAITQYLWRQSFKQKYMP